MGAGGLVPFCKNEKGAASVATGAGDAGGGVEGLVCSGDEVAAVANGQGDLCGVGTPVGAGAASIAATTIGEEQSPRGFGGGDEDDGAGAGKSWMRLGKGDRLFATCSASIASSTSSWSSW